MVIAMMRRNLIFLYLIHKNKLIISLRICVCVYGSIVSTSKTWILELKFGVPWEFLWTDNGGRDEGRCSGNIITKIFLSTFYYCKNIYIYEQIKWIYLFVIYIKKHFNIYYNFCGEWMFFLEGRRQRYFFKW